MVLDPSTRPSASVGMTIRNFFIASLFFAKLFLSLSVGFAEENPLIEVKKVIPNISLDIRYATKNNFVGEAMYEDARCFLRKETVAKLKLVQDKLNQKGLGLKIYDGYRPLSVQKKMWAKVPIEGYVANPVKGSNHNRGAAVDVTLVDLKSGKELPMPSAYDEFSEKAHRDYNGGTEEEKLNRQILEEAMHSEGFRGISTEWWHFDDADCKQYPVLDLIFSEL